MHQGLVSDRHIKTPGRFHHRSLWTHPEMLAPCGSSTWFRLQEMRHRMEMPDRAFIHQDQWQLAAQGDNKKQYTLMPQRIGLFRGGCVIISWMLLKGLEANTSHHSDFTMGNMGSFMLPRRVSVQWPCSCLLLKKFTQLFFQDYDWFLLYGARSRGSSSKVIG